MIYENGNIYEGDWVNNKSHGEGVFNEYNGSTYIG